MTTKLRRGLKIAVTHPFSAQLCVTVQFQGREGTGYDVLSSSLSLSLVSLDGWVYSCSNASRDFHKACPLCDARLRLCPLHLSTLYLVILYNEDNTKLLLTLFLEVSKKTCTLHYTSFYRLRQARGQQPDTSHRENASVFQDSATASILLSDAST